MDKAQPSEDRDAVLGAEDQGANSPVPMWRQARALRSTGKLQEAIAMLTRIIATDDATWTPLALLELSRLYEADLSQPAKTLDHARAFLERFQDHELAPEARKLTCQSLAQLGRTDPSLCP